MGLGGGGWFQLVLDCCFVGEECVHCLMLDVVWGEKLVEVGPGCCF